MKACAQCDGPVSDDYARVNGDNDDTVVGPCCEPATRGTPFVGGPTRDVV